MRLKNFYLENYKNFQKFEMIFDEESFLDVIIGKNGSGKSNLFEALIEIFRCLIEKDTFSFEYKIKYRIDSIDITIEYTKGKLLLNEKEVQKIGKKFLPENILIYYCGHNERISNLLKDYEQVYRNKIKGTEIKDIRLFFGLNNEHKNILLLILLLL